MRALCVLIRHQPFDINPGRARQLFQLGLPFNSTILLRREKRANRGLPISLWEPVLESQGSEVPERGGCGGEVQGLVGGEQFFLFLPIPSRLHKTNPSLQCYIRFSCFLGSHMLVTLAWKGEENMIHPYPYKRPTNGQTADK